MTELQPGWGTDPNSYDTPLTDFVTALSFMPLTAEVQPVVLSALIELSEIKSIERSSVSYHGTDWTPETGTGSELEMYVLGELNNGQWFTMEAGNDYTGWGCQDFSDIRVGSRDDVIRHGLSDSACEALGLPTVRDTEI